MNKHVRRFLTGCGVFGVVVGVVMGIVYLATHKGAGFYIGYTVAVGLLIYAIGFAWERE